MPKTILRTALRATTPLLAITAALLVARAAHADEPGPGGTKAPVPVTGEQVYKTVCQSCHMADGKGAEGAGRMPALAGNPRLAAAAYPIVTVARGRGAMPGFVGTLSPAQAANVVGYIRTHFGNAYAAPVTEAEVTKLYGTPPTPER
ncbi:cytochrome c [Sphingomonas sp. AP4-R1]|uniref:c-type cytochrome n=1 Tax=Sphingomonas sp. AP4-R1 TaxID=2735134 RepID=UPI001493463F|nr:cytochrome c [Sphingomonas sp. AP4-R1]QJU56800.1 cytochrome c [Sphingomonas sp. AP4-R1]